jgi:hypothetical protein
MIVISSVITILREDASPQILANNLNRTLKLSKDNKAMLFPMRISKFIWRKALKSDNCLLSNIPNWLVYNTHENICNDIEIALRVSLMATNIEKALLA